MVNEAIINYNNKEQEICDTFDNLSKLYNELQNVKKHYDELNDVPFRLLAYSKRSKEVVLFTIYDGAVEKLETYNTYYK